MIEVEQKFRVEQLSTVRESILREFPSIGQPVTVAQTDVYFAHPSRDFSQTDEALRIRRCGERIQVTYKGPRQVDSAAGRVTKTRQEIELDLGLAETHQDDFHALLESLGFRAVRSVSKVRESYSTHGGDWPLTISLDEVNELGSFVEIETITDERSMAEAQTVVRDVSKRFGFENEITTSYLELLINQDKQLRRTGDGEHASPQTNQADIN